MLPLWSFFSTDLSTDPLGAGGGRGELDAALAGAALAGGAALEVGAVKTLKGSEQPQPRPLRSAEDLNIAFGGPDFGRPEEEAAEPGATCDGALIADASAARKLA